MTMTRTASAAATILVSCSAVIGAARTAGQDALARAKDLYMSAAYEDALAVLGEYRAPSGTVEADEYRAFCLLALGKMDDATKVIEQIVTANPSFQPPDAQASPRIQEAFRSVRRRVLPTIVRQTYKDAKDAFDRADYETAARQFTRTTTLLADPEAGNSTDFADLRLLAKGFGELSQKQLAQKQAAAPAAPPPPPELTPPPPKPTANPDRTYGPEDPDVTPPVAVSQVVPPWRPTGPRPSSREIVLMLLIDETGTVVSVRLAGTLQPPYDAMLRQAASRWKYRPALRNGRPVKYQKAVAVRLDPSDSKE
jgi:tetratricopeptide (TPR) repeat protein